MSDPNPLHTLAARVERLTEPDRAVDAEIWLACTEGATRNQWSYVHQVTWRICEVDETRELQPDGSRRLIVVPAYTSSLDAAMTLVASEWTWDVTSTGAAWVQRDSVDNIQFARAASPSLALTAAALRARAEGGERG
jgi:hypothetical protein